MRSRPKTTRRIGVDRRTAIAGLAAPALFGLMPRRARAALPSASYTVIASDFVGGVNFIDGNVRCAINPAGRVAFVASQLLPPPTFQKAVLHGNGGTLAKLATESRGYSAIKALQIGTANRIAIAATRTSGGSSWVGIYRVTKPSVTTFYEGALPYVFGNPPPAQGRLEMANDGATLAFASLVSGQGGLYRSGFSGAPTLLRQGTGIFYNNRGLGVTAAGVIAAEMEYGDPYMGLTRGALVFDATTDTLATIESTVERGGIGLLIQVAMNGVGQMAFAVGVPVMIQYYSVPTGGGVPTTSLMIPAGVHVATPTAYGTPFTFTTVAAATDGFSSFGKVAINDSGAVVFEATAGSGRSGIFYGNDPVADVVAVTGEDVVMAGQNHFFSIVRLGGLNNAGQVAFQTSDFRSTDQQIWRAQL
jgi:hypothetical protein